MGQRGRQKYKRFSLDANSNHRNDTIMPYLFSEELSLETKEVLEHILLFYTFLHTKRFSSRLRLDGLILDSIVEGDVGWLEWLEWLLRRIRSFKW